MSPGSAAAFMLTGPAAKITNLGAVKIVLDISIDFININFMLLKQQTIPSKSCIVRL